MVKRMTHLLANSQNSSTSVDSSGSLTPHIIKNTHTKLSYYLLDEWTISIFKFQQTRKNW